MHSELVCKCELSPSSRENFEHNHLTNRIIKSIGITDWKAARVTSTAVVQVISPPYIGIAKSREQLHIAMT